MGWGRGALKGTQKWYEIKTACVAIFAHVIEGDEGTLYILIMIMGTKSACNAITRITFMESAHILLTTFHQIGNNFRPCMQ